MTEAKAVQTAELLLARGEVEAAAAALLPALEQRGDRVSAAAARVLRARAESAPVPPDALAAALDRLVRLVELQEAQIRSLRAAIEEAL